MEKINTVDRQILKMLFARDTTSIDLYSLHKDLLFSPAQIVRSVNRLAWLGVITIKSHSHISITTEGKNWILKNRLALFTTPKELRWKQIPERFLAQKKRFRMRDMNIEPSFFGSDLL